MIDIKKTFFILLTLLLILSFSFYSAFRSPTKAAGIVGTGTAESCNEDALVGAIATGGDINFYCGTNPVVIVLTKQIEITQNTALDGAGQVTISGKNLTRIFHVASGITLNLTKLTLSYGAANDPEDGSNRSGSGGAILNEGGTVNLTDATVQLSRADHNGGGIYNRTGTLNLLRTTVSGNTGSDNGGGIINEKGALNIANSTISGNYAGDNGGGVFNFGGTVTITNGTIADNNAALNGSGILNAQKGVVTIKNTIVSNYAAPGAPETGNCGGDIVDGGKNIQFPDKSCGDSIQTNDPNLGSLADNGGFAHTHALLDGSPAIDTADSSICNADPITKVDERTIVRPIGANCDIGAYEYDPNKPGKGRGGDTTIITNPQVCVTTTPVKKTPVPCPQGTFFNAKTGQCEKRQSCPQGTTYNSRTGTCDQNKTCGPNQTLTNGQCVPTLQCPADKPFNPSTGTCDQAYGCPAGQLHQPDGTCVCPQGFASVGGQCQAQTQCGANAFFDTAKKVCTCNNGYYLNQNNQCVVGKP